MTEYRPEAKRFTPRHFPVRPNLDQLRNQAKDLLRAIHGNDPDAVAELREHHPKAIDPSEVKLADAQLVLARAYGLPSWPRLVVACHMTEAIWRGDVETVRELVTRNPRLLHEAARGRPDSNWGPPMSYAANVGQDAIIAMLREMGAEDVQHAFDRACLQGKIETARKLYAMGARPLRGCVMGPCETLCASGLKFLLELGAELSDGGGNRLAPVALVLQTYARWPEGKHRCLEIMAEQRIALPDTPAMAVHRGRIDLLEKHLRSDPQLFARTLSHEEIYPPELGCGPDKSFGLHGTPLDGATLLHICVDFDEIEIARWMIGRGADVNARAAIDSDGFGGHTALFGCVVSQPYRAHCREDAEFARLLLDHGADPNARASPRKQLRFVADDTMHEYRDVTPLTWGQQFHDQDWVSPSVVKLIVERLGGHLSV
ncbi:MAG: ankyrin repeat domain-containing protein [Candidatus Acidiferrales bacterium]